MKIKFRKPVIKFRFDRHVPIIIVLIILGIAGGYYFQSHTESLKRSINSLYQERDKNYKDLANIKSELDSLKNEDQLLKNKSLQEEIKSIEKTYDQAVSSYELLLDLKVKTNKTDDLDKLFAKSLDFLSTRNYSSASSSLASLNAKIKEEDKKISSTFSIPQNIPQNNTPPQTGYSRQQVKTDSGEFMVSIAAADLGSTKVIVDTASDSNCTDNCPVLPLSTYVSRNNAYAGINGSYFCPTAYPSCAGKTNSYDLLAMNYKKTYFNSDNNVYSNNPAVIFGDSYIRFVGSASQWGRDTGPNGVLSNYPLLLSGGNITFTGDSDAKQSNKGGRSFVANKGNTVYIGVVHSATVAESAKVMKAMGMENALNLDDGGSTALWFGGYKIGPGRDLPNVILFVKK